MNFLVTMWLWLVTVKVTRTRDVLTNNNNSSFDFVIIINFDLSNCEITNNLLKGGKSEKSESSKFCTKVAICSKPSLGQSVSQAS